MRKTHIGEYCKNNGLCYLSKLSATEDEGQSTAHSLLITWRNYSWLWGHSKSVSWKNAMSKNLLNKLKHWQILILYFWKIISRQNMMRLEA